MILAENILQIPVATTIWMDFAMTLIQATNIDPKDRKCTGHRSRSREAIAPGNRLLIGCNHYTNHANDTWARRKALQSRQRTNFGSLEASANHQRPYIDLKIVLLPFCLISSEFCSPVN